MIDPKLSLDEQFWAQWIDAQGRNPEAWLDTAVALKRAADTLAPIYQGEMQAAFLYASSEALELPLSLGPVYITAPPLPLLGSALLVDERAFKTALMLDRSSLAKCDAFSTAT